MVLCLRVVGTACPAELLMPFWRCPASELQHTFELFCEAGVEHLVGIVLGEDRKGELPWKSLVLGFSALLQSLLAENARLRRSFAIQFRI